LVIVHIRIYSCHSFLLDPSHEALLLSRKSFSAEVPARVEYSMSEKGKSLGGVLKMLFTWVDANK